MEGLSRASQQQQRIDMKNIKLINTSVKAGEFWKESSLKEQGEAGEMKLVVLYPEETGGCIRGFGGAFTEAAAHTYSLMGQEAKDRMIDDLFGDEGLRYNLGRIHMNSCDFALGNYTYIREGDETLDSFDISHDEKEIIPMIKDASAKHGSQISLMMAPWSPPAFMKTNQEMNHGGKLKPEYSELWAAYFVRFIKEYSKRGIDISFVTVQNEPMATQTWDSCVYTSADEAEFVAKHLGPAFKKAGILDKTGIFVWDHNKEMAYDRFREIMENHEAAEYVSGCAVHWYTGDHFDTLDLIRKHYPDKEIFFTEGCVEYSRLSGAGDVHYAEMYAHQMIGNLNGGITAIFDWNLAVDHKGGPNHVGNFCDAPIKADETGEDYSKQLSYYYIGHFSRYIKEGAKHIASSRYTDKLEVSAFVNPDGERVVVILNKSDEKVPFVLKEAGSSAFIEMEPHTIATVTYEA